MMPAHLTVFIDKFLLV